MFFYLAANILQEIITMNFIYIMKNQNEVIAIGIQMMVFFVVYQQGFLVICLTSSNVKMKNLGVLKT